MMERFTMVLIGIILGWTLVGRPLPAQAGERSEVVQELRRIADALEKCR